MAQIKTTNGIVALFKIYKILGVFPFNAEETEILDNDGLKQYPCIETIVLSLKKFNEARDAEYAPIYSDGRKYPFYALSKYHREQLKKQGVEAFVEFEFENIAGKLNGLPNNGKIEDISSLFESAWSGNLGDIFLFELQMERGYKGKGIPVKRIQE